MFTKKYKGFYINGYVDRPECTVVENGKGLIGRCKSYRAAQIFITKHIADGK